MLKQEAIVAQHLSKSYQLYRSQREKLKGFLLGDRVGEPFYALRDINFSVNKGDSLGLIGMNGSGKSTLSNIIAGISPATAGTITIEGEAALIAVSSGLNNYLTGSENIELKGLMLGFTMEKIEKMRRSIEEFADIGNFINQPVKSYSSGMRARLGFAIAVNINPDIMIIDEALSVGDSVFSKKCLDKMNAFREGGKTIVFVSHSIGQIRSFCNKVLWLECGRQRAFGAAEEVTKAYGAFTAQYSTWSPDRQQAYRESVRM